MDSIRSKSAHLRDFELEHKPSKRFIIVYLNLEISAKSHPTPQRAGNVQYKGNICQEWTRLKDV